MSANQPNEEGQFLFVFFLFRKDNTLFLIIAVGMELWYGRSIEEDKCIVNISPPHSWGDGSRLQRYVFKLKELSWNFLSRKLLDLSLHTCAIGQALSLSKQQLSILCENSPLLAYNSTSPMSGHPLPHQDRTLLHPL